MIESVDVFQAVSIDQNRIRAIGQSIMTLAINSSPFQQFGMGLGIGWYVYINYITHVTLTKGYLGTSLSELAEQLPS